MMDQLRIIFKTLQSMKSADESETVLDRNLLPLKDVSSLQDMEEQLHSNPDLRKQMVCWQIITFPKTEVTSFSVFHSVCGGTYPVKRGDSKAAFLCAHIQSAHTQTATSQMHANTELCSLLLLFVL